MPLVEFASGSSHLLSAGKKGVSQAAQEICTALGEGGRGAAGALVRLSREFSGRRCERTRVRTRQPGASNFPRSRAELTLYFGGLVRFVMCHLDKVNLLAEFVLAPAAATREAQKQPWKPLCGSYKAQALKRKRCHGGSSSGRWYRPVYPWYDFQCPALGCLRQGTGNTIMCSHEICTVSCQDMSATPKTKLHCPEEWHWHVSQGNAHLLAQ